MGSMFSSRRGSLGRCVLSSALALTFLERAVAGDVGPAKNEPSGEVSCALSVSQERFPVDVPIFVLAWISNQGKRMLFILAESSAGELWTDVEKHRLVVAHYAHTAEREESLTGSAAMRETIARRFYVLPAGGRLQLWWKVRAGMLAAGSWPIEGKIAVHTKIDCLTGASCSEAERAIQERDFLVDCQPTAVVIGQVAP